MSVEYVWIGDGSEYLGGVPTRDLTAAEWNALPEEKRNAIRHLYKYTVTKAEKPKAEQAEPAKAEAPLVLTPPHFGALTGRKTMDQHELEGSLGLRPPERGDTITFLDGAPPTATKDETNEPA